MSAGEYFLRLKASLQANRALPPDVRDWLLSGLEAYERDRPTVGSLDAALGMTVGPGEAWRHPIRQMRRAEIEAEFLVVADLAGGRGSRQAGLISESLLGLRYRLPGMALDYLFRLQRRHGAELPTSRSAILQILRGETAAQRDGVVPGGRSE